MIFSHWVVDLFTHWGHSSYIGFSQDGDGDDLAKVEGKDFNPEKYRVYASWVSGYPVRKKDIDSVDPSMKDKDYIHYRDGDWQKNFGHMYEGKPQPWKCED